MRLTKLHAELAIAALFAAVVALVFQQTRGNMVEQGIASGGPYSNAASYPEALALLIAAVLIVTLAPRLWAARGHTPSGTPLTELSRPAAMLLAFACYLWALGAAGYLAATPFFMALIMYLAGVRSPVQLIVVPLAVTLALSAVFGGLLDVVLPRGQFGLAIPW